MSFAEIVLRYAPWSVSKVNVLDLCPRQFAWQHIEKAKAGPKSSESKVGTAAHAVAEHGLTNPPCDLAPVARAVCAKDALTAAEAAQVLAFVPGVEDYVRRIVAFRARADVVRTVVEQRLAMTPAFRAQQFFAKAANLMRGVLDELEVTRGGVAILIDHKSGRRKRIEEHAVQFNAYRVLVCANYPEVRGVQCAVNYLGSPKLEWAPRPDGTPGPWTRGEIEGQLHPWFVHYLNRLARDLAVVERDDPPTRPCWACGYCGFVHLCAPGQEQVARARAKREGVDL